MDKQTEDMVKSVSAFTALGTLFATARAFLKENESAQRKMKVWGACVCLSAAASFILYEFHWDAVWKGLIVGACGGFADVLWPIFESKAKSFFKNIKKPDGK